MKLGLKLLQERAKVGSFWWPYISNLPETYSVPIFFQGDDIKNLQYAPLLYQVPTLNLRLVSAKRSFFTILELLVVGGTQNGFLDLKISFEGSNYA